MFELPAADALAALSDEELSALRELAVNEGRALRASDAFSAADAERLELLVEGIRVIDEQIAANGAAAAELAARRDAVADVFADAPAAEVEVEAPAAELAAEATEAEVEVVAAATAPAGRQIVARAPKLNLPQAQETKALIAAAADLDVYGQSFATFKDVAPYAIRQLQGVQGTGNGSRKGIFTLEVPTSFALSGGSVEDDTNILKAASEAYVGNLYASEGVLAVGGWCAPTPQEYSICTTGQVDGIASFATVNVPRGSLSYFRGLDYNAVAAVAAAGFFSFTNAELEALPPVVKPCFEIPCLDPVTATLNVHGICIRGGILQRRAFPELTAAWLDQALVVFAHYLNAINLAEVAAAATNLGTSPASFGAIAALLSALDLKAMNIRFDEGRAMDYPVEILLPWWLPALLRADVSRKQFGAEWNFSMADWNSALAARNISAQYVKDGSDPTYGPWDAPFAGAADVDTWPATVPVIMYPAGAWVRGVLDVIRVDALQDSTLLTTNREQLLFLEAGSVMIPRCGNTYRFIIPVCPSGETAGPVAPVGVNVCPAP